MALTVCGGERSVFRLRLCRVFRALVDRVVAKHYVRIKGPISRGLWRSLREPKPSSTGVGVSAGAGAGPVLVAAKIARHSSDVKVKCEK